MRMTTQYLTIGEAADRIGVATSTLRYYEREGLLPMVERTSGGARRFKEEDFSWLSIISCLRATGMSIHDIRGFLAMVERGDATIDERRELLAEHRATVQAHIAELTEHLRLLDFKVWYYDTARRLGSVRAVEDGLADGSLQPPGVP